MNRDDVIKKEFPHAFIGYDVSEVDSFLDEVIREFDRLHNEIDILTLRLNELSAKIAETESCVSFIDISEKNGNADGAVIIGFSEQIDASDGVLPFDSPKIDRS